MFSKAVTALTAIVMIAMHAPAADAASWLDKAAAVDTSNIEREYAVRQTLLLADTSASILISALGEPGLKSQIAARLLGETDHPEAETPLLEAYYGQDPFLSAAAAQALAKRYARLSNDILLTMFRRGAREWVSPETEEEDWLRVAEREAARKSRFRSLAMRGLTIKYAAGDTAMPKELALRVWECLFDADPALRLHSIEALAVSRHPEATERLAAFLYMEQEPRLLASALRAMAALRPPQYGEAVERHAAHADPRVSIEALAALEAMGYKYAMFPPEGTRGNRSVAGFVLHPSTPVRLRAIELLSETPNPRSLDYLIVALGDRVGANRAAAAKALGELELSAAIGPLTPLLRDSWPEARMEAAKALHRLGVVGMATRMLDDLENGAIAEKRMAAASLAVIGDKQSIPGLLEALDSGDVELAVNTLRSLGRINDPSAGKKILYFMATATNPAVIDAARQALLDIFGDDPGDSRMSWESWAQRNAAKLK